MLGAKPSKEARHDLHLLLRHLGPVHLSRRVDRLQEVVVMKINTPTLWEQFRAIIGLPGKTRLEDALMDSARVCKMAQAWERKEVRNAETRTHR